MGLPWVYHGFYYGFTIGFNRKITMFIGKTEKLMKVSWVYRFVFYGCIGKDFNVEITGILMVNYPLVNVYIAMKNNHFRWVHLGRSTIDGPFQ